MPELPEIETIRRWLRDGGDGQPGILQAQITHAELLWRRTLAVPEADEFLNRVRGRSIEEVSRRGKFLILRLDEGYLLFHLRMSGDLLLEPAQAEIAPHHRLILYLADGRRLAFNDTRKFGRLWLVDDPQQVTGGLGLEPFDPQLTPQRFAASLRSSRRQLKTRLMDQAFLAGLGNIYTDEALHRARLHPLTRANRVSASQAGELLNGIRQTLELAIEHNGSSIDWVYRGGEFQQYLRVYGRKGQPCPVCGTSIQRTIVGQRGTHFCPTCQPLEEGQL